MNKEEKMTVSEMVDALAEINYECNPYYKVRVCARGEKIVFSLVKIGPYGIREDAGEHIHERKDCEKMVSENLNIFDYQLPPEVRAMFRDH